RPGMNAEVEHREVDASREVVGADMIPELETIDRCNLPGGKRLHLGDRGLAAEKGRQGRLRDAKVSRSARILRIVGEATFELEHELETFLEIVRCHSKPSCSEYRFDSVVETCQSLPISAAL